MSVHLQSHLRQVPRVTVEESKSQTRLSNCPRSCMKLGTEPSFLTSRADSTVSTHLSHQKYVQGLTIHQRDLPPSPEPARLVFFLSCMFLCSLKSTVGLKVGLFPLFPLATRKPRVDSMARLNADFMSHVNHILLLVQYHSYPVCCTPPPIFTNLQ